MAKKTLIGKLLSTFLEKVVELWQNDSFQLGIDSWLKGSQQRQLGKIQNSWGEFTGITILALPMHFTISISILMHVLFMNYIAFFVIFSILLQVMCGFSKRDIQAGEEICTNYFGFNEFYGYEYTVQKNSSKTAQSFEEIRTMLALEHDIICLSTERWHFAISRY